MDTQRAEIGASFRAPRVKDNSVQILRFASATEYLAMAGNLKRYSNILDKNEQQKRCSAEFFGDHCFTIDDTVDYICNLPQDIVTRAEKLIESVDANVSRKSAVWKRDVWGVRENPALVEIGHPMAYKRRVPVQSQKTAIDIWIEIGISSGIEERELQNRACALAALVRKMQDERPAKIHLIQSFAKYGGHNVIFSVNIDMQPAPLPLLLGVMATKESVRALAFAYAEKYCGGTPNQSTRWGLSRTNDGIINKAREEEIRRLLLITQNDIVFQCGHFSSKAMFSSDPTQWVNEQLEKQRNIP